MNEHNVTRSFSKLLFVCITFILFRSAIDLFIGISTNNALNFIFGFIGLSLVGAFFKDGWWQRALLWSGVFLIIRSIINMFIMYSIFGHITLEAVLHFPLSALPNFMISFVIPLILGFYLIQMYKKDRVNLSNQVIEKN